MEILFLARSSSLESFSELNALNTTVLVGVGGGRVLLLGKNEPRRSQGALPPTIALYPRPPPLTIQGLANVSYSVPSTLKGQ